MANQPLRVGDPAPDFALPDENGQTVRLSDFRGKRVVVYFYPMDDTPGCTLQACNFRDAYLDVQERNAVILGISPDDAASHTAFRTKYNLPFTLLVDTDHKVAEEYGAWPEGASYITRSQFIVGEDGRLVDVQLPVKAAESVQKALDVLAG
jgi:thioredoxin-dependent peroxiredoxin